MYVCWLLYNIWCTKITEEILPEFAERNDVLHGTPLNIQEKPCNYSYIVMYVF